MRNKIHKITFVNFKALDKYNVTVFHSCNPWVGLGACKNHKLTIIKSEGFVGSQGYLIHSWEKKPTDSFFFFFLIVQPWHLLGKTVTFILSLLSILAEACTSVSFCLQGLRWQRILAQAELNNKKNWVT